MLRILHQSPDRITCHATAVGYGDRGCLIIGESGSGKSTLALDLIMGGGELLADDIVVLRPNDQGIEMCAQNAGFNAIEARFLGLINAPSRQTAPLSFCITLNETENKRLPDPQFVELFSHKIRLFRRPAHAAYSSAVLALLRYGIAERNDVKT